MTQNKVADGWLEDIRRVSRKAARDWPGVVEAEDVAQEVLVKVLEAPATQRDLAEMGTSSRYQTLHKIAQRIASQERDDYDRFSGRFRYSVDEVRSLLETAGDPERSELGSSWSTGDYTRYGGMHSDASVGSALRNIGLSNAQQQLASAMAELKVSNERQHDALVSRFVYGNVPPHEDGATRKVIERALISVTNKMNHAHKRSHINRTDGPGTRKPVKASTARYLTKEGWDADYTPAPAHLRDNHIEKEVWE